MRGLFRRGTAAATLASVAVIVLVSLADRADAFIYWTSNAQTGVIGKSPIAGGDDVDCCLLPTDSGSYGLAVAGPHIYWSNQDGVIEHATYDGKEHDANFIYANYPPGGAGAVGLAVGGPYIFWTDQLGNSIGRAIWYDGSAVNQKLITGVGATTGIATEYATGKHVYWTHPTGIGRANFDGTDVEQNLITGLDNPFAVAVNDEHIYWVDQYHYYVDPGCCNALEGYYTIGSANLDGTGVNRTFITGLEVLPHGIAVDNDYIYWTASDQDDIGRSSLKGGLAHDVNGTEVEESWLFGMKGHPEQIAVESLLGGSKALGSGLTCDSEPATMVGTSEGEELAGTAGVDVIYAGGGNDVVRALKGADVVCGNGGDDELWAHRGDDELHGGAGKDELRARAGDDHLFGGAHSDQLYGGDGSDVHTGGSGQDSCNESSAAGAAGADGCEAAIGSATQPLDSGP